MQRSWSTVTYWSMIAAAISGCSHAPNTPPTAPVHGCVTLKGKPIEGAQVAFFCQVPGSRPALGKTDAQGRFALSTFGVDDGAVPGRHTVVISKFAYDGKVNDPAPQATKNGARSVAPLGPMTLGVPKAKSILPLRYSKTSESGLVAEVAPEGSEINFDLKSE